MEIDERLLTIPVNEEALVERLRKRAAIRRKIRSEADRIANLLDEAADRIEELEYEVYK